MERSLKLNLFFLRIMKEHAFFIAAALLPVNADLVAEGERIHSYFSELLGRAVKLAAGRVDILPDAVTPYTLKAEQKTGALTRFSFNTEITATETSLSKRQAADFVDVTDSVRRLNNDAISATRVIIRYKTKVLNEFLACRLFTFNYPLLIDHIRREALEFLDHLENLERGTPLASDANAVAFWNRIMKEHAEFARGLLDPTEEELIVVADGFAQRFKEMLRLSVTPGKDGQLAANRKAVADFRAFNVQGTEGLLECQIKAVIAPLLADHLIRESDHFLLILDNKI